MNISPDDVCLTLTSGGCNSLNLLLHGAGHVVSVDCNPAQSALLELKAVGLKQLDFEDFWQMFGEGRHPRIKQLFETKLAPFLSQKSYEFWSTRLWYFKQGLYYQGGMVSAHKTEAACGNKLAVRDMPRISVVDGVFVCVCGCWVCLILASLRTGQW